MSKLNKQEINAIASKALRVLTKKKEEVHLEAVKNYKPSEKYTELKIKLERLLEIKKIKNALEKEASVLANDVNNLISFSHSWVYGDSIYDEEILNRYLKSFINNEVNINPIPTLEELKEDITIAAIDEEFNAEIFINNLIEKYK